MTRRIVVVGAGLAGATTATTLRELGFDGAVVLVGAEPVLPYERPALSKAHLAGDGTVTDLLLHGSAVYDDLGIEVVLDATAVAADLQSRTVELAGGRLLPYDDLVVATGSVNRRPDLAGMGLAGVHQLRTVADADALRVDARRAARAVVVGQGFVGCEVAATLRSAGTDVAMVDPLPGPLWGPLGPQVSARVTAWHTEHGVRLHNGVGVAALSGSDRVEQVRLGDGRVLPADLVVVGVGARPATDWLATGALSLVDGAVATDELGRTPVAGVWAVGDVAARWDARLGRHRRVEHFDSALVQGQQLARTLLGQEPAPAAPSWFWSEQYDHVLQYAGVHGRTDRLVWRGERTAGWFDEQGSLSAVVAVDQGREFRRALRLLGEPVDRTAFADATADLRALAASV